LTTDPPLAREQSGRRAGKSAAIDGATFHLATLKATDA
jgi:hypothetical protein